MLVECPGMHVAGRLVGFDAEIKGCQFAAKCLCY